MSAWQDDVRRVLSPFGEVRAFSHVDFGRERVPGALSVVIPGGDAMVSDEAIATLRTVRAQLPGGTVALLGTSRWLGDDANALDGMVELFVVEGKDPFDAVSHSKVDAINFGLETEAVVARLRKLDADYGLDLVRAETDTVEGFITGKNIDWERLAEELNEFCPDVVDQGVGDVGSLVDALKEDGRVYLWWD